MPALTQVEIEKLYNGEYWVNRYHLSVPISDALAPANAIVAAERAVHWTGITFTKMNVRTTAVGDEQYFTVVLNTMGQFDLAGGQIVPLFVVARVDFTAIIGRPSRKFLRGVLDEAQVNIDQISTIRQNTINQNYASVLAALSEYVDVDGDELIAGACSPKTGMRQLRRGSKKKSIPSLGGTPL